MHGGRSLEPRATFGLLKPRQTVKSFWPFENGSSKNDPRGQPITPIFYHRHLFYNKNGGGCIKLKLNILKIDCTIVILSLKIYVIFVSLRKIAITQTILRISLEIFVVHDQVTLNPFNFMFNVGQQLFQESKRRSPLAENSFGVEG